MTYLQVLRTFELKSALSNFPPNCSVLEIGAGSGWQASILNDHGFSVEAVDIAVPCACDMDVQEYDGQNLPFPNNSFDVVFSSNTLEHIADVREFQKEIARVLRPGGIAIHILPTATWRFWTSITHYIFVIRAICRSFGGQKNPELVTISSSIQKNSYLTLILKAIFPPRHGEQGNFISEIWYFSRFWWRKLFSETGWEVVAIRPMQLFYTGSIVFGLHLPIEARRNLSRIFGSSTSLYILKRQTLS